MNESQMFPWQEIEPLCLLRQVLRNVWVIILAALIGFFSVKTVQTMDVTRTYSSSATFVVTSRSGSSYSNLISATASAETYAKVLQSDLMKKIVLQSLNYECDGTISAQQLGTTNLISVSVTSGNPRDALLMMDAISENYGALAEYVSSTAVLTVLNTPSVSTRVTSALSNTNLPRYAAVACAALMVVILMLITAMSGTVQNAEGAKNRLDAPIIGSIPHDRQMSAWILGPRRKRQRLNVTSTTVSFAFSEAIHRLASKLEYEKSSGKTVFLLTSVTQTEGKSTVAANVALSLAMKKSSVLFLDLDLRRPVQAANLNVPVTPDHELGRLLHTGASAQQILNVVQVEPNSGLHCLLSTRTYKNAPQLLASKTLAQIIATAREKYDYVIVDLPPIGFFSEGELLSDLADASVLVVRQDVVSAGIINDCIDALRSGSAEFLGCVLNDMNNLHTAAASYGYGYGYGKRYGKYGYGYQQSAPDDEQSK